MKYLLLVICHRVLAQKSIIRGDPSTQNIALQPWSYTMKISAKVSKEKDTSYVRNNNSMLKRAMWCEQRNQRGDHGWMFYWKMLYFAWVLRRLYVAVTSHEPHDVSTPQRVSILLMRRIHRLLVIPSQVTSNARSVPIPWCDHLHKFATHEVQTSTEQHSS